ncbi:TonB-dependent receptor [Asticcacaulis sp. 201]|uniref:TonB-dependent receptor n=1 Tax=Asticcacaulis sp. 201 TaxID=3028787 RepID=UPI002916670E|nr:TonB-dependent receptor [Asticcacaulis sp. 201]MDV6330824.1 TonB-dependent receptor [Asticcacaulis sp. 201]
MKKIKSISLYSGLLTAALMATTAWAEPVISSVPTAQADENATEVILTARKRSEAIQDVPLSISAISGVDLERRDVQDVNALYGQVPGLFTAPGSVSNSSDLAYLTMRGVGFNAGLEPAVGVFIDGMYQPQIGFDTAMLDLQRVEILRGPQGTLFGRNTQGGAVNMITRKPGPEPHGRLSVEGATFGTIRALATLDGPIAANLYGGLSASYGRSDGFIYNTVLGQHQDNYEQSAVRGTLRWIPREGLDLTLMADASRRRYNEAVRGVRLAGNHRQSPIDQDRPDAKHNHGLQLNVTGDLTDHLTFTSITGYRYSDSDNLLDMDNRASTGGTAILPAYLGLAPSPVAVHGATLAAQVDQAFTSQEFRLEGSSEKVNWLAGLYYFEQDQNQARQRQAGPGAAPTVPAAFYINERFKDVRKGAAAFGQFNYRPAPEIELTVGARYSQEKVDGTGSKVSVFGAPLNRASPLVRDGHPDFDNLSWMASAAYKLAPDVSVYATYAEGWKAGGVDRYPGRADNLVYKDENSRNYELGVKSVFLDRRLVLNASAYHIDIENQQLNNVIPDPRGGPVPITVIQDAAHSHVNGFEAELTARPLKGLRINGSLSYSDGVFDDFVRTFSPTDIFDMSGTPFENVPKVTAYASAQYSRNLPGGRTLDLFAEYSHVGKIIFQDNTRMSKARDQLTTPAYDRVNVSAAATLRSGLRVTLYVNNLLNSFDYSYASSDPFLGGDVFVVPLAPRQVGLRLSKTF